MKKFLAVIILILTLQTPSQADDIRDFQIEGMSIGDSLLDYMSKDEINMNDLKFYPNDSKYYEIEYAGKSDIFETLSMHIKRNDKKYEIYAIRAFFYIDDKSACLKKRDEIVKDIKSLFNDVFFEEGNIKHYLYKDSTQYIAQFSFQPKKKYSDHIRVECFIAGKKSKKEVASGLNLVSSSSEFEKWLDSL